MAEELRRRHAFRQLRLDREQQLAKDLLGNIDYRDNPADECAAQQAAVQQCLLSRTARREVSCEPQVQRLRRCHQGIVL